MTSKQAFKDSRFQNTEHLNSSAINQKICRSFDFNSGDNIGILQDKSMFDCNEKFSNDLYKVEGRKGYKIITSGGIYKPNELSKLIRSKILYQNHL